jgi:acyl-CoA synthetase (NDP forming)
MVVDQLGVRGIPVANMQDLTLAGTRYEVMKGALDAQLASPDVDLVIAVPGSSARYEPHLAVKPVIDSAAAGKPIAAFVVPDAPEALAMLGAAGVPNFRTPEACADAVAAAFSRHPREVNRSRAASRPREGEKTLDELSSYGLLARAGIRHSPAQAVDASLEHSLLYPVAVKALSAAIAHKSDVGGVVLDVAGTEELRAATQRIRATTNAERFLVQQMARGVGEALVGYRVDAQVGPIVMLAAGGLLAEIHRDRSIRLAPVDMETAREMVGEVASFRALRGYRGRAPADLEALAGAVVALSRLADDPAVLEAEVNPLVVMEEGRGVVAVDALARVAP